MSTIVIKVNGVDITDDVYIAGSTFESKVNGAVGVARLKVKDPTHSYDFISGGSLTLDIDSVRVWGGYIMQALKVYALSVVDTTNAQTRTRIWEIDGVDYNVLFNKRIVFKDSDPTGKLDFSYAVGTHDDTIINDIFDNYLSIGSDGLSRSGVTRIAIAILDLPGTGAKGTVASAGMTWKDAMDDIQRVTGGVYFINPSKVLSYVDAETPTSTYTLTDQPAGGNDVGYQSFTLLEDGTKLVNDVIVWGTSSGSPNVVVSRVQDGTSISDHNRWQVGVNASVFRQASADFIANSYVYGTPQSHRGGKDDARTFTARVFRPLFQAGDVVAIEANTFGYTESLPIRKMTTSFINDTTAVFDLMLSYDIDQAFSFYEYLWPKFHFPGIGPFPIPVFPPAEPGGCDCGITDSFARTTSAGDLGISDAGIGYTDFGGGFTGFVDGSKLNLTYSAAGSTWFFEYEHVLIDVTLDFTFTGEGQFVVGVGGGAWNAIVRFTPSAGGFLGGLYIAIEDPSSSLVTLAQSRGANTVYRLHFVVDEAGGHLNVWDASGSEPGGWQLEELTGPFSDSGFLSFSNSNVTGSSHQVIYVDNLTIPTLTKCTIAQFDNFDRINGGAWGTAEPSGYIWDTSGINTVASVDSGSGHLAPVDSASSTITARAKIANNGPWNDSFTFTGQFIFHAVGVGGFRATYFLIAQPGLGTDSATIRIEASDTAGEILLWSGSGTPTAGVNAVSTTRNWVQDQTYNIEWVHNRPSTGTDTVTIWALDEDRPGSPDLTLGTGPNPTFTGGASGPLFDLDIITAAAHVTDEWEWLYMDFDYQGRPCYVTCQVVDFDDFNRTVGSGWGTATPDGHVWTETGSGTATTSVVPASGANWGYGKAVLNPSVQRFQTVSAPGPWNTATGYDLTFWFWANPVNCTFNIFDSDLAVDFYINVDTVHGYVDLLTDNDNNEDFILTNAWSPSTWYIARLQYIPGGAAGSAKCKVWAVGDPEPDAWLLQTIGAGVPSGDYTVTTRASTPGNEMRVAQIVFIPCPAGSGVAPSAGAPNSGPFCETLTHSITTDTFATSKAFFSGSLNVWVNGTLQTDFTFTASLGQFVLSAPITPAEVLRVCYRANGDPA